MNVVPLREYPSHHVQSCVNLVSEPEGLFRIPLGQLEANFEIRRFPPQDVIHRTTFDREQIMQGVIATLVAWDESSPLVLHMLKDVARRNAVPLVVLCGPSKAEQVAALVVGGDDCLTYPLNPVILEARLLAYRRIVGTRAKPPGATGDGVVATIVPAVDLAIPEEHDVCIAGPMILDRTARHFFVCGEALELTPKEFDLMAFLMQHAGTCQSRDEILDQVWGINYEAETNVLEVLMHGLRRKLATHGLEAMIQTVRGVGYRFVDS